MNVPDGYREVAVPAIGDRHHISYHFADSGREIELIGENRGLSSLLDRIAGEVRTTESSPESRSPCRRCVSTSKRSALAWSSLPCSTTRTVGCRSTSAATMPPDGRGVSNVSARLAPANADERGGVAREPLRTTVVQHDEHQRAPTSAYEGGGASVPIRPFIRGNAYERPRGPMGVGALITRRSQVRRNAPAAPRRGDRELQ